jgi:ABC-type anion transport system duplicated permease subunit
MQEAQAQTVEVIGAAQGAAEWYTGQAGIVAGTWAIVAVGLLVLIVLLYKRLEKRDLEISSLKVDCAKEIAQAKIDAAKEAEAKVEMAWERVNQIYSSVQTLFSKSDTSNEKVADALGKLTVVLATKGVLS